MLKEIKMHKIGKWKLFPDIIIIMLDIGRDMNFVLKNY